MPDCEMCGSNVSSLVTAKVEGTIMKVCSNCAKYGLKFENPLERRNNFNSRTKRIFNDPDENKVIVKNYSKIIKQAREKSNLKQEQVAKRLNEKESLIHSVESGSLKPSFKTARKLEKFFNIKLIEEIPDLPEEVNSLRAEESGPLTMGDLLKKAMKK